MQFLFFYRSLISDWNHTNALFLRGVVKELQQRGHKVRVFEPAEGWSLHNLTRDYGPTAIPEFSHTSITLVGSAKGVIFEMHGRRSAQERTPFKLRQEWSEQ
jgi:spore maturation protein CgeB